MVNIFLVMLGGFIGTILRFFTGEWLHSNQGFPIGTFTVNLLGCFLLGAFFSYIKEEYPRIYIFLGTGLVGAFTTFSTFSVETINLIKQDQYLLAVTYSLISVVGGLGLTFLGSRFSIRKGVTT